MAPPHSPVAGQASLEYVAASLLVAAVLAVAVPVAGHPPLAKTVAQGIRHGLCVVTGAICTDADAQAAGLTPCTLSSLGDGEEDGASVTIVSLGSRSNAVLAERSDGTLHLTRGEDFDASAGASLRVSGVGGALEAGLGYEEAATWVFRDRAQFEDYMRAHADPEELVRRYPPTYRYRSLAGDVEAGAGGLGVDARLAIGRRTGQGLDTIFLRARVDDPGPFRALPGMGRWDAITVEHSRNGSAPREIAFHLEGPGSRRGTLLRVTGRLDLRDPANAAAAEALLSLRPEWPPALVSRLRSAVDRTMAAGTVESELFSVEDKESGIDLSLPIVKGLGFRHLKHSRELKLLAAKAWTAGQLRDREDCRT